MEHCCSSAPTRALLHGDLHHGNILAAQREPWLAVNPKGVIGEPAYEAAALVRSPESLHGDPNARRILADRVDQIAELIWLEPRTHPWMGLRASCARDRMVHRGPR